MKKKKNKNFLDAKQQIKEAIAYLKESQQYIYSITIIFFFSIFLGFIFRENLSFLNEMLKDLINKTSGFGTGELIFFILQNNLKTALLSILLGVFLGIFPIINAIGNGIVIGYVLGLAYQMTGTSDWWRLLPHGIFELPAIFIALGLGTKLGFAIFSKNRVKEFKKRFYNSLNVFLLIIIPLLIIAAIIEGILISLIK